MKSICLHVSLKTKDSFRHTVKKYHNTLLVGLSSSSSPCHTLQHWHCSMNVLYCCGDHHSVLCCFCICGMFTSSNEPTVFLQFSTKLEVFKIHSVLMWKVFNIDYWSLFFQAFVCHLNLSSSPEECMEWNESCAWWWILIIYEEASHYFSFFRLYVLKLSFPDCSLGSNCCIK